MEFLITCATTKRQICKECSKIGLEEIPTKGGQIRIHLLGDEGSDRSVEIESYKYNPCFGCDVRFFEWIGETVVLIYREKHWTFAVVFGGKRGLVFGTPHSSSCLSFSVGRL